jgi:hypothetical protein
MIHSWTTGVFEAAPPNSDPANELGLKVRNLKVAARERLEVEHDWSDNGAQTDTGRHKFEIVADDAALAALTPTNDGMIAFQSDVDGPFLFDTTWKSLKGAAYLTAAARAAIVTTRLTAGFLVYESDTEKVWGWNGAAWVQLFPGPGWIAVDVASDNAQAAVAADTWEDITGAYNGGTQLGIGITAPNDTRAYELDVTAVVRFGSNENSHHGACQLLEEVGGGGASGVDEDHVQWSSAKGTACSVLHRHVASATNNTLYEYTVQWASDTIGNKVVVNPTGAYLGKSAGIWATTSWSRIWGSIKIRQA